MTKFEDGPAKGTTLMLAFQPQFLRVVKNRKTGEVDALDKPDDKATQDEQIFVYHRKKAGPMVCLDGTKNGKRWAWNGRPCTYALWSTNDSPVQTELRDAKHWKQWCQSRAEIPGYQTEIQ